MLSYMVYRDAHWLHFDEHTWTTRIEDAAEFTNAKLAADIGERERGDWEGTIHILAEGAFE